MSNAASLLNQFLPGFKKDDPEFLAFISDPAGVAGPIVTPKDYNLGAIGNVLEWLRQFSIELARQIDFSQAETYWLNYINDNFFKIVRYASETDAALVARIRKFLTAYKVSPAAIIAATIPFSSPGMPVILEQPLDVAFANVSYARYYKKVLINQPGSPYDATWVMPAITGSSHGGFNFILVLQNTAAQDTQKVIDILNRFKAAGITYQVVIET